MLIKLKQYKEDKQLDTNYKLAKSLGKAQTSVERWLDQQAMIDTETGHIWIKTTRTPCELESE